MRIQKKKNVCFICGKTLRSHNKKGHCRKHGTGSFDQLTGRCLTCGKTMEVSLRGHHAATKCETIAPWNKGETKETNEGMMEVSRKLTGRKRPEVGRKIMERMKDPKIKAKYKAGWSRGQRKRFQNPEEVEKHRERIKEKFKRGNGFGWKQHGRNTGAGGNFTESEWEMRFRLLPLGFAQEHVIRTKLKSPWPTCYTLDFAHPGKRIAVELDGSSHESKKVKERDARKDEFLRSIGWRVFRFQEPLNYDEVEQTCADLAST